MKSWKKTTLQGKKKKQHGMVRNTNQVSKWNCKKFYKKIFTHDILAITPKFNSAGLITCNNWHWQGLLMAIVNVSKPISHSLMTNKRKHMVYGSKNEGESSQILAWTKPIVSSQKELMEMRADQMLRGKNKQMHEIMHLPSVNQLVLPQKHQKMTMVSHTSLNSVKWDWV